MGTTKADIAKRIGISRTTVSLVLNDAPNNISQSTRKKIIASAREMGYFPKNARRPYFIENARRQNMELGLWGSPETLEAIKELLSEFESSSGIHVGIFYATTNYERSLEQSFRKGFSPDIFWLNDGFRKFIDSGWLMDLTPYLNQDSNFDSCIFPLEIWEKFNYGGKIYSLPKDMNVDVLYYNKNLFRQSGIEYPDKGWTWKDFLKISQKLTDPQKDQFGFSYGTEWLPWIWQNGGDVLDKEGKECQVDKPESIKALQFLQDLKFKHKVVPQKSSFDGQLSVELFKTGKVGMSILPRWGIIPFRHIREFDWDITHLPEGRSGLFTSLHLGGLNISKFTKYPKESWQLLKRMVSKKWQERIWGITGESLPANKFAKITKIDDLFLPPEHQNVFEDSVKYGRLPSYFYHYHDREIREILDKDISKIVLSPADVKDVCTKIKKKVDNLIKNH